MQFVLASLHRKVPKVQSAIRSFAMAGNTLGRWLNAPQAAQTALEREEKRVYPTRLASRASCFNRHVR
eukprot:2705301-Alexandrium_andersonii.AAC.1